MKRYTKEDIHEFEIALKEMQSSLLRESKKLRKGAQDAVPGMSAWPALNNNNDPYKAYRFSIAMAGAPDVKTDRSGPIGGDFITTSFSSGDEEILNSASKQMGVARSSLTSKKSKETNDIHKISPTANKKRNRYGI